MDGIEKNFRNEVVSQLVYSELAKRERNPSVRQVLLKLAESERRHVEVWKKIGGRKNVQLSRLTLRDRLKVLIYRGYHSILGTRLTVRLLEAGELGSIKAYYRLLQDSTLTDEERSLVKGLIIDELEHEEALVGKEFRGEGIRDAVYGVSDGLIEVLAGSSGLAGFFTSSTLIALGGTIIGVSGALSMAVGAYLSTSSQLELATSQKSKSDIQSEIDPPSIVNRLKLKFMDEGMTGAVAERIAQDLKDLAPSLVTPASNERPARSAMNTGLAYVLGAAVPVIPYAAGVSGLSGIIISFAATAIATFAVGFIIGTLSDVNPVRKGVQMAALAMGAALGTHFIGIAASRILHISVV